MVHVPGSFDQGESGPKLSPLGVGRGGIGQGRLTAINLGGARRSDKVEICGGAEGHPGTLSRTPPRRQGSAGRGRLSPLALSLGKRVEEL